MSTLHLLPLDDYELHVVRDALVAFANDLGDDPCNHSAIADVISDRLGRMLPIAHEPARQLMKAFGIGRYNGRPQG